ncbi:MAG: hypothetical protein ACE37J_14400 [Pikeienuella sp.]|uniref:hypothetical protein n=1 Tax=Pikeienuella sp. TaxID=2831957 RepID=UPI00391C9314
MKGAASLLLVLLGLGFAGLAALPWLGARGAPPPPTAAEAAAAAPAAFAAPEEATTDLSAFLARPLFSAARRPPPPEAPGLPLADPNAGLLFGAYEIAGVVVLGDSALAMLRDREGRLLRLRAGDSVETPEGAAELISVGLDGLTFRHLGATVVAPVRREGASTE